MIDIDHFKKINDAYGHECGDKVLIGVSRNIKQTLREQDTVARWGGEEFLCILPETEINGGKKAAEKIRKTIEKYSINYNGTHISVTVSLGLSLYDGSCSFKDCIHSADDALFESKKRGRNQFVIADEIGDN
jgi:diguanylate cyclase (GGDEF)-like protein